MRKLIIMAIMLLLLLGFSGTGTAGVRINIGIPLPPPFVIAAPPEVVVIPGTYVYYYPDVDFDLFFYGGYWFRPFGGYWFRSGSYGGPWVHIEGPPSVLLNIGNIITGEDWNTKDTRELLLNLEKEATADMVAESMEEVDTKVMKDVRV